MLIETATIIDTDCKTIVTKYAVKYLTSPELYLSERGTWTEDLTDAELHDRYDDADKQDRDHTKTRIVKILVVQ